MSADLHATVARVKPGDEVTATFSATSGWATRAMIFAISGTVWTFDGQILVGREVLRNFDGHASANLTDLVINQPAPDPEPPIGSVVLDADDEAWQLLPYGPPGTPYWQSAAGNTSLSWDRLNCLYAPLRVIHTPEVTS